MLLAHVLLISWWSTDSGWFLVSMGLIVLSFGFIAYLAMRGNRSEGISSKVESLTKEKIPSMSDFTVDPHDIHLFRSDYCPMSVRFYADPKNKDKATFTTSHPHLLTEGDMKELSSQVLSLTGFALEKQHEIVLSKSSASRWDELKDDILKYIIFHLNSQYSWRFKEQIIVINWEGMFDSYSFEFTFKLSKHKGIISLLESINGLIHSERNNGEYSFWLSKGNLFKWEDLMPDIQDIFRKYFPKVRFVRSSNQSY
jgi:hypothetical protein